MIEIASESKKNIITALLKAHREFPPVLKDSTNPHFKNAYASLESVLSAVNKTLLDNDLVIVQTFENECLKTALYHSSGEWLSGSQKLLIEKQNAQGYASASTYARRYGILAILNLSAEDDDGQSSTGKLQPKADPIPKAMLPIFNRANAIGIIRSIQGKLEKSGYAFQPSTIELLAGIDAADEKTLNATHEKIKAVAMKQGIKL